MENPTGSFGRLIARLESYISTSIELAKLKLVAAISQAAANFIASGIVLSVAALSLFIFSIGAGYWLGELLGKTYFGFFAVAGFYLLLALILGFLAKMHFKKGIANYLIRKFMK